ncbi:hypothetical protein M231_04686 [Tremella mesenterica]|uniref:Uncharacterized protein n=1 Tax=Tremella mesenterica TaxID=5217 RepID=A0A4V1M3T8_TREME|nr:hypothetical protein M231_04686 [Tremella mesenterica]
MLRSDLYQRHIQPSAYGRCFIRSPLDTRHDVLPEPDLDFSTTRTLYKLRTSTLTPASSLSSLRSPWTASLGLLKARTPLICSRKKISRHRSQRSSLHPEKSKSTAEFEMVSPLSRRDAEINHADSIGFWTRPWMSSMIHAIYSSIRTSSTNVRAQPRTAPTGHLT